jgi:hypothetical protein
MRLEGRVSPRMVEGYGGCMIALDGSSWRLHSPLKKNTCWGTKMCEPMRETWEDERRVWNQKEECEIDEKKKYWVIDL